MRTGNAPQYALTRINPILLFGVFIIVAAVLAVPFDSVRSSSQPIIFSQASAPGQPAKVSQISLLPASNSLSPWLPVPTSSPETIETFASDCATPRTLFVLGEVVCAKVSFVSETDRFVNWLSPPDSHVAFSSPTITTNLSQDFLYTPTVVGTWKATIADPSDSSIVPTAFEVVAPGPLLTHAAGCFIPQGIFNLGNDVCVHVTGGLVAPRRIVWIDPSGFSRQTTAITADPQNDTFSVPATATSILANGVEVSNLGTWRVSMLSSRGSLVAFTTFVVKDPGNATAQLFIDKRSPLIGEQISAGSTATFTIVVGNNGPNTAQNVTVTDVVPTDTTFVSIAPSAGCVTPSLGGTGTITCTIPSLDRGDSVSLDVSFTVNVGTASGTLIANTATVGSDTSDGNTADNSSTSYIRVTDTGTASCTLDCPANMTVQANTTQAGQPGAFVTFSSASVVGNCGAVSNNPGSGSFFAVGTHLITSTADSGNTCTFTVTVVDTPPPTITCPVDKTVTAASGASSAAVAVGTPTTNPSTGVTVVGIRSDDPNCTDTEIDPGCTPVPLTDPYPLGTTTITWTVIQSNGQKASCVQRITVNENNCGSDTTPPTITAPPSVTFGTGPDPSVSKFCSVALDDELGQATATDDCSFSITTTGIPANNAFPVGTTTVTYTAIDGAGNVSLPATQLVTVFDNTPPIIVAPPDASYTCLSEVPTGAAAIALARGDDPSLPNGGPPTDNCGTPVITYSDSSTGAGSAASPRVITRTYTATDTSPLHNASSAVQTITVIDPTPPTITCPANIVVYLPANSTATSMPVTYGVSATDNCSGVGVVSTPASGSVFPVGTTTVNSTATDAAGNTASCSFTITVLYNFTGFFSPINNLPTLNSVNAGRAIPIKFSLSGDKGLNIFALNSPYSVSFNCATNDPGVDVVGTTTAGGSSLSYSPDTYHYNWKTESSWAGTCRQLVVKLNDGSVHSANFKFK